MLLLDQDEATAAFTTSAEIHTVTLFTGTQSRGRRLKQNRLSFAVVEDRLLFSLETEQHLPSAFFVHRHNDNRTIVSFCVR